MTLNPEEYKLTPEQQLSYDKLQGSFYHFHRQYPSLSYYGNIPAQYSENTVSWIQWMHWIEGWIKTINDNQNKLNDDFNDFVDQFNKFLDDLPDYVVGLIKEKFDKERPGMITEITDGVEDKIKEDLTDPIQKQVDEITAQNDGIPKLFQLVYNNDEFKEDSAPSAEFIVSPRLARNAVLQAIGYDARLGQFYISQADNKNPEGMVITRTNAGGELLSQMWLSGAGHGSTMFIRTRESNTPLIFFQVGSYYYKVAYQDNATVDISNAIQAFKPPLNGNGMLTFTDQYMAHINGLTAEKLLTIYPAKYNKNNGTFDFPEGNNQSVDISNLLTGDNVLQGLGILKKSDVTGSITDDYLIFISVGAPNTSFKAIVYEYIVKDNKLNRLNDIVDLQNVVKPLLAANNTDWGNSFEPEAFTRISIDGGGRNGGYVNGLVWGISSGDLLKRKHYLFGFVNPLMSNYLTSARNSFTEVPTVNYISNNVTQLYNIYKEGQYELSAEDLRRMIDGPSHYRNINSGSDWTLDVSKNNHNGDFIQTIYRRGYNSRMEIYTRGINFQTGYYGDQYLPKTIGKWNTIMMDSPIALILTDDNIVNLNKLSDFNVPGTSYYVSKSKNSLITDFEGAESVLTNIAFKITVSSWGGAGDLIMQKVEYFTHNQMGVLYRTIPATSDTYGPGLIANVSTIPKWTNITGTLIN